MKKVAFAYIFKMVDFTSEKEAMDYYYKVRGQPGAKADMPYQSAENQWTVQVYVPYQKDIPTGY